MKTITTAIAAALFATGATGATASNIYGGFGNNNPDLSVGYATVQMDVTGVQPGVGDSFDRYHGWANNNPDLFSATGAPRSTHESPDRYGSFDDGNSDLQ